MSKTERVSRHKSIYESLGREPVHPFPARMAPEVALQVLSGAEKSLRVLDPMMGSGTVVALARLKGHKAVGVDIDPLAVLISEAWTSTADADKARKSARQVLARARALFASLPQRDAYPTGLDAESRQFVRYWFDGHSRRQLTALSKAIRSVRNHATRKILLCAFSRLIITKQAGASLAKDLSHSRPHKCFKYAPCKPFRKFLAAVDRVAENCVQKSDRRRGPAPDLHLGDARALPIKDASIDLVLTSPPYLNAIDYMRCSKFSLVWMDYGIPELRSIRSVSVGTASSSSFSFRDAATLEIIRRLELRPRLNQKDEGTLAHYIADMQESMAEAARVLVPGGRAVYVVGENMIRGSYVRNSRIITVLAERCGLALQTRRTRVLPANRRYLPPPSGRRRSAPLDGRMRREVVLTFEKIKK